MANGLLLESGPIEILAYDSEGFEQDYDPNIAADQAEMAASESGINILRNKELAFIAVNQRGDVVGAIWKALYHDDDQDAEVYDFDVAVHPEARGQDMVGIRLINAALDDFESMRFDFPRSYVSLHVINSRLADVLERRYGFEVEAEYPSEGNFGAKRMVYYGK